MGGAHDIRLDTDDYLILSVERPWLHPMAVAGERFGSEAR
jgi:hypothetical protein